MKIIVYFACIAYFLTSCATYTQAVKAYNDTVETIEDIKDIAYCSSVGLPECVVEEILP